MWYDLENSSDELEARVMIRSECLDSSCGAQFKADACFDLARWMSEGRDTLRATYSVNGPAHAG